jgi:hypothetical protein
MASVLKVDKLDPQSGTALEIGTSGDTVSIPSGATLDISASTLTPPATMPASSGVNLTALNATQLTSGTVPTARLSGVGIDADADAWARVSPVTDQDSAAVVDFPTSIHLGSNVTESGGRMTVGTAGWYLVSFHFSNQSHFTDSMLVYLRKNTTRQLGSITWYDNTEIGYIGMDATVLVECAADDILDIYGEGYWNGNTTNVALTWFTGVRLGA